MSKSAVMSMAMVTTSVVVVSYRPGDWLLPCLRSVVGQADEVVLVDNGSKGFGAARLGWQAGARVLRLPVQHGLCPGGQPRRSCLHG